MNLCHNVAQDQPKYYVDMLIVSTIINLEFVFLTKKLVETLEQFSTNVGEECESQKLKKH